MNNETEIWKPVVGYEDTYTVSSFGRVMRIDKQRIMTTNGKQSYAKVMLCQNGQTKLKMVHVLVAAAFIGVCPQGYEVNHIDLNKRNNHITNLEYTTHAKNIQHAASNFAWSSTVSSQVALMIKDDAAQGLTYNEIAAKYDIGVGQVRKICRGKSYTYGDQTKLGRKVKLQKSDVQGIRSLINQGIFSQLEIARIYEVSPGTISRIKDGTYNSNSSKEHHEN